MHLAKNLKLYRQQSHLTQNKLANQLHVSRKTISNWENGRSQPSFQTLDELSKIYKVSTTNLLSDKSKQINKSILISYFLNLILLIAYYLTSVYNLRLSNFIQLLLCFNLIFLIINYKKWRYVIKNKIVLSLILFVSFSDLIFNSWLHLSFSIGFQDIIHMDKAYQVGVISGLISNVILLTISFFIALLLSEYFKFMFNELKL